jgi:hypothetical protein
MNRRHRWTESEINYLKNNYFSMKPAKISENLKISLVALYVKANKLKLKTFRPNNNLEILLNMELQSLYWIGFIMADGHFHKSQKYLRVQVSKKDENHLKEYVEYIGGNRQIKFSKTKISKIGKVFDSCYYQCNHLKAVSEIKRRFDMSNDKSRNPPNLEKVFSTLSDNQKIALIIGFIDGDGYVQLCHSGSNKKFTRIKINIECHFSWFNNLNFIKKFLYTKVNKLHRCTSARINHDNLARIEICCTAVNNMLFEFIKLNDLTVLGRKWGNFEKVKKFNRHNMTTTVPNVIV